ncbi:MAG: FKBP-type peptidyl-prolyl cis-trans isomerase [Actinomycetota bacterium]|nr:FKBP-type peptidyl-prolyl cis-trans isomerase [Actinomycetota bacterium]
MRRIAVLLCLLMALTACGGEGKKAEDKAAAPTTKGLPTVSGDAGKKPTVKAPSSAPPKELKAEVLEEGDGDTVKSGDLLVANYLGQTWRENKVFDNSYDRGEASGFPIGVGGVVPGWDKSLVGKKVGSRVLLVLPPAEGYGPQGNEQAGIKGDDTLVFVVDIVNRFGKDLTAKGSPVDKVPAGLPKVSTESGKAATITLAKGAKPPAKPLSAVVIRGNGDAIDAKKNLVLQAVQADYKSGKTTFSSYEKSPVTIKADRIPGLAKALAGQKLGSRVVLALPSGQGGQAAAFALDVVGMY